MDPIVLSIPIFLLLIVTELVWAWMKGKQLYRIGDVFSNIGCGILEQLTGLFVKVFTVAAFSVIYQEYRLFTIPTTWPWLILLYLGIDFCYYWAHRMSHEINLFWIGHVVHHQSEDYNLSVALRQGALQKLFTTSFFLPLAFLGFNDVWFLYISAFNTLYQFWIHTELIDRLPRWYEFIFNTPSHHRVHHARNPQYIDKNHGGSLIIWDRLFGTFAEEEETVRFGVTQPVASWNPLKAHWQPVRQLFHQVHKGRARLATVLFRSPTWLSKNIPELYETDTDKSAFGFDTRYPRPMMIYLGVQIALIIAQTAFLLFNVPSFSTPQQLLIVSLMLLQFYLLSLVFEGHALAFATEWIRAAVFTATVYVLLNLAFPWLVGIFLLLCVPLPFMRRWRVDVEFAKA